MKNKIRITSSSAEMILSTVAGAEKFTLPEFVSKLTWIEWTPSSQFTTLSIIFTQEAHVIPSIDNSAHWISEEGFSDFSEERISSPITVALNCPN